MKNEIKNTLLLIWFFVIIGLLWYFAHNGFFSSSWVRTYGNGKEIVYRVPSDFKNCPTLEELANKERELQKELSNESMTKVEYLDTIFRAFCIDYDNMEVSPDIEWEQRQQQKIVTKAIELWVLQSDPKKSFKFDSRVSRIEWLALLFRLSGIELKGNLSQYNYRDVSDDWKHDIAAKASHLWLVYTSASQNRFYPNQIMSQWDAYRILKEIAQFYKYN